MAGVTLDLRIGRSKMFPEKTTTLSWWSPGWGFDSWLEGGPCAILRQNLPIAFRATGMGVHGWGHSG